MSTMAEIQEEKANILKEWDDPDLTPEQLHELEARIHEAIEKQTLKVDALASYIRMRNAYIDACKSEAKRLQEKARSAEAQIDWLKNEYLETMEKYGIKKIKGEAYALTVTKRKSVEITDMDAIIRGCPEFVREKIDYAPDKAAIKDAIEAGADIPGARIVEREFLRVS